MQKIQKFFTNLKAWKLFIVMIVIPLGTQLATMGWVIASLSDTAGEELGRDTFLVLMSVFSVTMILFTAILEGWIWSCGMELNRRVASSERMKSNLFKVSVFFPLAYIPFFILVMLIGTLGDGPSGLTVIIFPLHLFAMFCMIYQMYFFSKNLAANEKERKPEFGDYLGYMVLLWMYPIGVWMLQPRVNRIVKPATA